MIMTMVILISLSDLFGPAAKVEILDGMIEQATPVYIAVLYAFLFPIVDVVFANVVKYIKVLKLSADDWLFGYNFAWSLVVSIIAIYCWQKDVVAFELKYLIAGSISGVCTMIGALLATHALKIDGAPQGPTMALCNSKLLLLVAIDSII